MGTTADKLNRLINTKEGIRQELNRAYGTEEISTSDTFNSYIQKLEEHPYYVMRYIERSLESIKLSNVTSISDYAFQSCQNLTEVSFPNATNIGNYAFRDCSSLTEATEVSFPKVTSIGGNAFKSCSSLTRVSFPNAERVDGYTFQDCSSLAIVSLPKVTRIGGYLFYNCSSLTSISLPEATNLDVGAFSGCSGLTEVSIPKATIINQNAFLRCTSLTEVSFPEATSIGGNVFESCRGLTSVSLPKVKSIGEAAFRYCFSLTSVSSPNVTRIDGYAFQECSSLTSVSIPKATSIGNYAFFNCSSLTTIYVGTELDTVCTLSNTSAIPSSVTDIYVPSSLVDSYKSATNWSTFADKIKAVPTPMPIGGKIFYDAGDNGATYTFYDSNGNVINDTSISGLQSAVKYKVEGNPTKDRFYAVYPSTLNSGNPVYWGFYYNADIKFSGGNKVNTGTAIGTGKTNTQAILNYIDTYASSETASTSRPSSDISQASPNGYNLYKNCGTDKNYLWDILRDANNNSLEGYSDWFIPSKDELKQIATSGVISSITGSQYIWSSSAYSSITTWFWNWGLEAMDSNTRNLNNRCVVCRAF